MYVTSATHARIGCWSSELATLAHREQRVRWLSDRCASSCDGRAEAAQSWACRIRRAIRLRLQRMPSARSSILHLRTAIHSPMRGEGMGNPPGQLVIFSFARTQWAFLRLHNTRSRIPPVPGTSCSLDTRLDAPR
jgi:hypothetical protein